MASDCRTRHVKHEKIYVGFSFCMELNYNSKNVVTGTSLVVTCSRYIFACIFQIRIMYLNFLKICPGDLSGSETFSISPCY